MQRINLLSSKPKSPVSLTSHVVLPPAFFQRSCRILSVSNCSLSARSLAFSLHRSSAHVVFQIKGRAFLLLLTVAFVAQIAVGILHGRLLANGLTWATNFFLFLHRSICLLVPSAHLARQIVLTKTLVHGAADWDKKASMSPDLNVNNQNNNNDHRHLPLTRHATPDFTLMSSITCLHHPSCRKKKTFTISQPKHFVFSSSFELSYNQEKELIDNMNITQM